MKKLFLFILFISLSSFADTMSVGMKESKVREVLSNHIFLKKFNLKVESVDVNYAEESLLHYIPFIGQIAAVEYFGDRGDQDLDEVHVKLSKNTGSPSKKVYYVLNCTLNTERVEISITTQYSLRLKQCMIENIETGKEQDLSGLTIGTNWSEKFLEEEASLSKSINSNDRNGNDSKVHANQGFSTSSNRAVQI